MADAELILFIFHKYAIFPPHSILSFTSGMSFLNNTINVLLLKHSPTDSCHCRADALLFLAHIPPETSSSLGNWVYPGTTYSPGVLFTESALEVLLWMFVLLHVVECIEARMLSSHPRNEWNMQAPRNRPAASTVRMEMPVILRRCL